MKRRKYILLIVLLLAIGFAAVSTTLYINGNTNINPNQEDFNVYYSDAYVNGVQDKSVITSDTTIEFSTTFETLGQEYVLDYEVTNGSKNYDAELEMVCTSSSEYLEVNNDFDDDSILESQSKREGTLTITQIKSYTGEDLSVNITCTINANALERNTLGEEIPDTLYILEGTYKDENDQVISNANLVIFSNTPHYVTTDEDGYLFYNGLEYGSHEIYHVNKELDEIKEMTKKEIISAAESSANFKTQEEIDQILFSNSNVIDNFYLEDKEIYCGNLLGETWEFNYTNNEQELLIKCEGTYKLETWGAQGGGYGSYTGGYGAYATGEIQLSPGIKTYINVGGAGKTGYKNSAGYLTAGGYNGGGNNTSAIYGYGGTGGGATHIATSTGLLSTLKDSLEDILIVSAGGGAGGQETEYIAYCYGGHAGGIVGGTGSNNPNRGDGGGAPGVAGTQTTGYAFGLGGNGTSWSGSGGSGLYGGYAGCGGAGGSSYIGNNSLVNKSMYCYNCKTSDDESTKTISTTCTNSNPNTNCSKKGNGYAKITLISLN